MAKQIFIGGLAYSLTDQDVEKLFNEFGAITSVRIIKDRDSGQSKGFGFVEMSDDNEAQKAINALNGKEVSGRSIVVNIARPKENQPHR